jgi:gas vesicle protein
MGEGTQQLKRDIEETRGHLGATLDTIGDRVSPHQIVARRKRRFKEKVGSLRDSVMGTATSVEQTVQTGAHAVADQASATAGAVADEVRHAPEQVLRGTQGSPLAAGLVAFGLGMIVASLIPASDPERRAAAAVTDRLEPLKDQARELGAEMKDTVQDAASQAADEVASTARESVDEVKGAAQSAAADFKDEARSAVHDIEDEATDPGGNGAGTR